MRQGGIGGDQQDGGVAGRGDAIDAGLQADSGGEVSVEAQAAGLGQVEKIGDLAGAGAGGVVAGAAEDEGGLPCGRVEQANEGHGAWEGGGWAACPAEEEKLR